MDVRKEIPRKALYLDQLEEVPNSKVTGGTHSIVKKHFKENGKIILGYLKLIDEKKYPVFLGELAVFASLIASLILGKTRAATDRLVFDNSGTRIIGTISESLEGFDPLLLNDEPIPPDPEEKEKKIPSTETLLRENVLELLLVCLFLANDDLHPHNISLKGILDFDMFFILISRIIKRPRFIDNWSPFSLKTPEKMHVKSMDIANFPCITEAFCTHWPTYWSPGNLNYKKAYPGYLAFVALGANPSIDIDGEKVSAQQQILMAMLKILLTKQPEIIKKLLNDNFGNLPMDYQSLSPDISKELEVAAPELFNQENNNKPFSHFAWKYYKFIHDSFYKVVVFSETCPKNFANVEVPAFTDQLHHSPQIYHKVRKTLLQREDLVAAKTLQLSNSSLFKSAKTPGYIDEEMIEQRFHQIFRDSHTLRLYDLWKRAVISVNKIINEVLKTKTPVEFVKLNGLTPTDTKLKMAMGIFGNPEFTAIEVIEKDLLCDEYNDIRVGLTGRGVVSESYRSAKTMGMMPLIIEWFAIIKEYYSKKAKDLKSEDSSLFVDKIYKLYSQRSAIATLLGSVTTSARDFSSIMEELWKTAENMRFDDYLSPNRKIVPLTKIQSTVLSIPDCISDLFLWIKDLKPDTMDIYLQSVVKRYNQLHTGRDGGRSLEATTYIELSKKEPSDMRLAQLLCDPLHLKGTMNQTCIEVLLYEMVQSRDYVSVNSGVLRNEFKERSLKNLTFYVPECIKYATQLVNDKYDKMVRTILDAVDIFYKKDKMQFKGFLAGVEKLYEEGKTFGASWVFNSRKIVNHFNVSDTPSVIIWKILSEKQAGWEPNSCNTILCNKLLQGFDPVKSEFNPILSGFDPGKFKFVDKKQQTISIVHLNIFAGRMKTHAETSSAKPVAKAFVF